MPVRKKNSTTPEEREEERRESARKANQNRNAEQLDRRNQIAEGLDESRGEEFDDVEGEEILPRAGTKRTHNRGARSAEDEAEAAAAREEEEAEQERQRLERAAEAGGEDDDEEVDEGRRPHDDDDDEEEEDEGRVAADGEGEEEESRVTNGVRYYRTIVNGKEKWLTLKQLRETAQKVESADDYLRNAAASVRRAAELDPSHEDDQADEDDDDAEEILNKALLGDQESVKKLAQRLKAAPSRVTPDVLRAVDERMTFRQAVNWFEEEFEEELSDPRLKAMIVQEDARLAEEAPTMGYRQRLKKAGNAIRKWKAGLTGEAGDEGGERPGSRGSNKNEPSEKERRKRALGSVPRAGGRLVEGRDEGEEESVGQVINKMAQGRGQPRAVRHEKH